MSIYDDAKRALQDVLAPELKELKGELSAINIRIDGIEKNLDTRFAAIDKNLDIRFAGLNQRFDDLIERLDLKKRVEKLEQEREEKRAS